MLVQYQAQLQAAVFTALDSQETNARSAQERLSQHLETRTGTGIALSISFAQLFLVSLSLSLSLSLSGMLRSKISSITATYPPRNHVVLLQGNSWPFLCLSTWNATSCSIANPCFCRRVLLSVRQASVFKKFGCV